MARHVAAGGARAWPAPATDPAMLKAIAPDLRRADAGHRDRAVLLDLLEPVPLGRPHARALGHRPLQRRPAELRGGGRVAGRRVAGARRSTTCCRTSRPSTSRRRSSTAAGARGVRRARPRSTASSTSRCCSSARCDLLAAGLQVDDAPPLRRAACCSCCCWPRSSACRRCASAGARRCRRATRQPAVRAVAGGAEARWRCRTTRSLADVYWIRAVQHYGGTKLVAPSRTSSYDLLYPLLDLTTSLDPHFNIAYRFGAIFLAEPPPGGPGRPDQAIALLREGARGAAATTGSSPRTSASSTTGGSSDYATAAEWFDRAARDPGAPNWLEPLAAVTLAAGRQPRRVAPAVAGRSLDQRRGRLAARRRPRCRLQQLDAMDQIDALERRRRASTSSAPARRPRSWARAGRAPACSAACRSIRPAIRIGSIRTAARHARPQSPLNPLPLPSGRSADDRRAAGPSSCSALLGLRRRQLPQRLHLPAAARASRSSGRRRTARVQPRARVVREHAGRELAGAARPLPHLRRADRVDVSDRRAGDRRAVRRRRICVYGVDAAAGGAAAVRAAR